MKGVERLDDPVLAEVVYNYELTVNREMGRAVVNLSGSFLFVSASDFACGCLDADGRILTSVAWSLQMGYAISNTVKACLRRFAGRIEPGDMYFCNDPYDGGGLHAHDVVIVAPVFAEDELIMWVGVCAHVTDVGGALPGGYSIEPMECYGENVRFSPVKFYDAGAYRPEILDAFLTNVRVPEQTGTDIKALMGAVWIGRERMSALISQRGSATVQSIHRYQIEQTAQAMRDRIRAMPDGVYQGAAHMEHDGRDDRVYTIRATVTKCGEQITFDYTGTDPQAPGILNCSDVGGIGNVIAALGTVIAPDLPFNEGLMEPVDVVSPPGTLVNAVKPAPIAAATVFAAWFGTDAILEAVNYMIAGNESTAHRATGPWGSWTFAWMMGPNQHGEPWFWNVFTGGAGGGGAVPDHDGVPAVMGIQTVDAFAPNIEDYEAQSPALFLERRLVPDSGGVGRRRGGQCLESFCLPWNTDGWDLIVFHNRLSTPSSAVSGGQPGAGSAIRIARGVGPDALRCLRESQAPPLRDYIDGAEELPARAKGLRVEAEDGYYMRATGGPGYGDPIDRSLDDVQKDLDFGIVSRSMATDAYEVVVTDDGVIDSEASERLRRNRREQRRSLPTTRERVDAGDLDDDGPIPTGRTQILGEYLQISPEGHYECRDCGHRYCGTRSNWKWFAAFAEDDIDARVLMTDIRRRPTRDLVYRRYFCPSCGIQADTEVSLPDEAPRWNYRPLELVDGAAIEAAVPTDGEAPN